MAYIVKVIPSILFVTIQEEESSYSHLAIDIPSESMKKASTSIVIPSLSLLFLAVVMTASAQFAALPCHFNSMCSCKMMGPSRQADSFDSSRETDARNRTLTDLDELLPDGTERIRANSDFESEDLEQEDREENQLGGDISCVGVPFAFLPGKSDSISSIKYFEPNSIA